MCYIFIQLHHISNNRHAAESWLDVN